MGIKQAIDLITEGCERGEDPAWNFLHESAGKSHSDQRAAPTTAFRIVLHQTLCDFWTKGSGQIPKDKAMAEKERSATSRLKTQLKMEEHQKWVEENGEMGDGNDIGSLGGGGHLIPGHNQANAAPPNQTSTRSIVLLHTDVHSL